MRQHVASSAGHSDTTCPGADGHPAHSLLQAKASKFLKNLSNFARGGKNSSTHPYNNGCRHDQPKPYLSQPALAVANFSPEQDESPSSASPSPQSRFPAPTVAALDVGSQSLGLANGGRSDDPAHPRTTEDSQFPRKTISHTTRSPNSLTIPTSPVSRRGVSFDIPRSEGGSLDIMSPLTTPPENLANIPDHRSPYRMATTSSPDLTSGFGWSSTTNLVSQAPKIEGLPDIGESIDPNLFKSLQRTGQPPADEVPNLTPDRTPTPPIRSPMFSQPPNYHEATKSPMLTPANISPAILPQKRVALLRLSSMPPPAFTVNDEDGSVRLSPALMGRRFTTSVRPLPPTSIAPRSHSPAPSLRSNASRTRLRSVPALAMDGTNDGDGSGDDDDDDDGHVPINSSPMSEDEDEDVMAEREGSSSTFVRVNTSPEGPPPGPDIPPRVLDGEEVPDLKPPHDYFSVHSARKDSLSWMSPSSNPNRAPPTPKDRPAMLYHQSSKSMVDLLSRQRRDLSVIDEETKGKGRATDSVSSAAATEVNILSEGSRIQRRRSLPTFTEATEPPPYPSLEIPTRPAPRVFPRDEEGMERLPPYTNDILFSGIFPRKLEFTSPGVQARDRKWRRALCVLEGTAFRVFEPPASVVGIGAVGRWWERRVGVGDLTSDVPLSKMMGTAVPGSQKIDGDLDDVEDSSTIRSTPIIVVPERETVSPSRKPKLHPTGFLHRNGNVSGSSSRRQSGETHGDDGRLSASAPRPSVSSVTSGRPSVSSHKRAASSMSTGSARHEYGPCPRKCQALRVYTLQHAESGLASDYLKRKNVIRVRMEGEQFLLQAPSVQAVVEWIEGFQTATGIALDLDERPMPKGPMFPRRRRRRAQAPTNPNAQAGGRTDSFRRYPRS